MLSCLIAQYKESEEAAGLRAGCWAQVFRISHDLMFYRESSVRGQDKGNPKGCGKICARLSCYSLTEDNHTTMHRSTEWPLKEKELGITLSRSLTYLGDYTTWLEMKRSRRGVFSRAQRAPGSRNMCIAVITRRMG